MNTTVPLYPDMRLYQEVIFLDTHFKGKYCVENVIPYYEPLILGKKRGRHLYWSNFNLPSDLGERKHSIMEGKSEVKQWCAFHEYDFTKYKGTQRKDKVARDLVDFEAGRTILETALNIKKQNDIKQSSLFDELF